MAARTLVCGIKYFLLNTWVKRNSLNVNCDQNVLKLAKEDALVLASSLTSFDKNP